MPSERQTERTLRVYGTGFVSASDSAGATLDDMGRLDLGEDEIRQLFSLIAEGANSLAPASSARFLPDSVVGTIRIFVRDESATFHYLADADQREVQGLEISDAMLRAIEIFQDLFGRLAEQHRE